MLLPLKKYEQETKVLRMRTRTSCIFLNITCTCSYLNPIKIEGQRKIESPLCLDLVMNMKTLYFYLFVLLTLFYFILIINRSKKFEKKKAQDSDFEMLRKIRKLTSQTKSSPNHSVKNQIKKIETKKPNRIALFLGLGFIFANLNQNETN